MKNKNVVIGFKKTLKALRDNKLEKIIITNNLPGSIREILSNTKTEIFEGSGDDLGALCGKPFNISVLGILGD